MYIYIYRIGNVTECQLLAFCTYKYILVGGLEHFLFFHILGKSSSQLTFILFRGVGQPPTSIYIYKYVYIYIHVQTTNQDIYIYIYICIIMYYHP